MTLREIFSLGNKQKNVDLFNMISNSTNYQDQEAYDELINYLDKTGEEILWNSMTLKNLKNLRKKIKKMVRHLDKRKNFLSWKIMDS